MVFVILVIILSVLGVGRGFFLLFGVFFGTGELV
jgi:hypothetical protein